MYHISQNLLCDRQVSGSETNSTVNHNTFQFLRTNHRATPATLVLLLMFLLFFLWRSFLRMVLETIFLNSLQASLSILFACSSLHWQHLNYTMSLWCIKLIFYSLCKYLNSHHAEEVDQTVNNLSSFPSSNILMALRSINI